MAVAETTIAVTPLKLTTFCKAVVLNPVPLIETVAPTGPRAGANPTTLNCPDVMREIDKIFPTAS